jgi:hypothetical protein
MYQSIIPFIILNILHYIYFLFNSEARQAIISLLPPFRFLGPGCISSRKFDRRNTYKLYISLENLDVLFYDDIIYVLYNLYYVDQINDL